VDTEVKTLAEAHVTTVENSLLFSVAGKRTKLIQNFLYQPDEEIVAVNLRSSQ
jgi:hypothetical protein